MTSESRTILTAARAAHARRFPFGGKMEAESFPSDAARRVAPEGVRGLVLLSKDFVNHQEYAALMVRRATGRGVPRQPEVKASIKSGETLCPTANPNDLNPSRLYARGQLPGIDSVPRQSARDLLE